MIKQSILDIANRLEVNTTKEFNKNVNSENKSRRRISFSELTQLVEKFIKENNVEYCEIVSAYGDIVLSCTRNKTEEELICDIEIKQEQNLHSAQQFEKIAKTFRELAELPIE